MRSSVMPASVKKPFCSPIYQGQLGALAAPRRPAWIVSAARLDEAYRQDDAISAPPKMAIQFAVQTCLLRVIATPLRSLPQLNDFFAMLADRPQRRNVQ